MESYPGLWYGMECMHGDLNLEDILTDRAVEEDLLEVPLTDKVFRRFSWISGIVIFLVLAQIVNVGVFQHGFYVKRAIANMSDIKTEVAPRGIIYDRFGNPLIKNDPAFDAFLVPSELPKDADSRSAIIARVSKLLGLQEAEVRMKIEKRDWSLRSDLLLKHAISHDEIVALSSAALQGIQITPSFERVPIIPFTFAHLLGYTGLVNESDLRGNQNLAIDDQVGRAGLERVYDTYLRGADGKTMIVTNARGERQNERVIAQPTIGDSLATYIDKDMQRYFYDELQTKIRALGRNVGVGIAMNPQNGEVLALFSIPSYDSNHVAASLNAPFNPMFNRAVSGLYSPGSTVKPLVATGALAEGILDPNHEIYSPGYLDIPNPYDPSHPSRFLDWQPQGWVNLFSALARSSDVYFYEVGGGFGDQRGLGITRLRSWWEKFGLNVTTGIDLPNENAGFLPDPQWKERVKGEPWRLGDTFNVSIGQGDLVITPIELLNYVNAIANGGKFVTPRVMKDIKDAQGNIVLKSAPSVRADISSEIGKVLPLVRQGMRDTVMKPYGTAYLLHDLPIEVAAKTGSAQVENNAKTNAFFVGYAPYQDPQIAIVILVENAREGSLNVVPVARDFFLWYYKNRMK